MKTNKNRKKRETNGIEKKSVIEGVLLDFQYYCKGFYEVEDFASEIFTLNIVLWNNKQQDITWLCILLCCTQ